jgi:hypothetical protein
MDDLPDKLLPRYVVWMSLACKYQLDRIIVVRYQPEEPVRVPEKKIPLL